MITINVAKDFSLTPGGRFRSMGPKSGEEFREKLISILKKNPSQEVIVILDGTEGYGSSFLEEAFGGLVREKIFSHETLKQRLHIEARDPYFKSYENEAKKYIIDAMKRI